MVHLACWAHVRREFEKALDNDRERAGQAMSWIQTLYEVERYATEQQMSPAQRAAMVYSLLGPCKLHGVKPTQWLTHVLANILQTKYNDVRSLYPQYFSHSQPAG